MAKAKKKPAKKVIKVKAKTAAPKKAKSKNAEFTAKEFIERLKALQSDAELEKIQRYFKSEKGQYGAGDKFMGVRMGSLFTLSKEFIGMPIAEIEKLLESPIHEVRAGACSIMNYQGRNNKTPENYRKELFDLYIKRHDRINNWDLVDLAAQYVIGRYLHDKRRDLLYKLAISKKMWERRTAIVATSYFLRQGEVEETFTIAELIVNDKEDLVNKAMGGWIREAGKQDSKRLLSFLDKHAATMPRVGLRYAIEHLNKKQKEFYMGAKDAG